MATARTPLPTRSGNRRTSSQCVSSCGELRHTRCSSVQMSHHHHHHHLLSLKAAAQLGVMLAVAVAYVAAQMLPEPSPVMLEAAGEAGGRHGDSVSKVAKPSYVLAVDGDVYVSEFWENRVVRIRGASAATVFAAGGGLDGPWGLAAIDDVLLVASFATDRIHRYNISTGELVGMFGTEDELDCPEGIAIGIDGTIYVASFLSDTVVRYTSEGVHLGTIAPEGLQGPEDVAVLSNGDIIVTSHYSDEILRVSSDGSETRVFSSIEAPVGVTVGLDGHVYAVSYSKHAVVRYNGVTGVFMDYFATGGFLQGPSALSFASTRLLYVSSYENDRVVLYNASTRMSFTVPMRARPTVLVRD